MTGRHQTSRQNQGHRPQEERVPVVQSSVIILERIVRNCIFSSLFTCQTSWFSLQEAAYASFSHGFAALGAVERQCAHLQFQKPRNKPQLPDILVKQTLLYGVETWGPSLSKANSWKDLERPLLSMIACMVRSKALGPDRGGSSPNNHRGIIPISDFNPTTLRAP